MNLAEQLEQAQAEGRRRGRELVAARAWPNQAVAALLESQLGASRQGRWWLAHGEIVSVSKVRVGRFGLGKCHSNAGWLARRWPNHYRHWTGYALAPDPACLDHHSWIETGGVHVEVTYPEPSAFYLGLPVPPDLLWRNDGHPDDLVAFSALDGRGRGGGPCGHTPDTCEG